MSFKKDYPELFQFFAGYFPDADFDNMSDEDVVAAYIADCKKSAKSKSDLDESKKELSHLISNVEEYWREIGEEANRYFRNSGEVLNWLNMINQQLQK